MLTRMKRPQAVPPHAKPLPDGRWVEENHNEKGLPHNGWRYYDAQGETVEIAYFNEGTYTKSYRYLPQATVTIDLAARKGQITRATRGAEDAVHIADDLPSFPSRETKTIVFTMSDVDVVARTFVIGEVTCFDQAGKRLSVSGGVGAPPVEGAVLVKAKDDRMWRVGARDAGLSRYYEIDGTPAFELEFDDAQLVAIAMYVDGSWVRQRFLPTPAFFTEALTIEHEPGRHVITRRGKKRELAPSADLAGLVKRARSFFEPLLDTSGVVLRCGEHEVTRFTHIPCRKPFAVTCIAELSGGDEYVVVLEPGPYQGQVFYNCHEEGLFSVDTLDEWVEDELPELLRKGETVKSVLADPTRLVSLAPFIQYPVAPSVEAFITGLRVELDEDWYKRLKPFVGKALRNPKLPPSVTVEPAKEVPKAGAKKRATRSAK